MLRGRRPSPRKRRLTPETGPVDAPATSSSQALVGTLIALYAVFDTVPVGLPILVLAANFNPVAVFVGAASAIMLLNIACCTWIDSNWGSWIAGRGAKVGAKLDRLRQGESVSKTLRWITSGSGLRFAVAAAIVNAILVVGTARIATGLPVGGRRIRIASTAYGLIFAGVFSLCGYALGKVIEAV